MEILMPSFGEGMKEGKITKWFVEEGDILEFDQLFFEITTEKLANEVYAETSGRVVKLLFEEGETVKSGEVIAIVE